MTSHHATELFRPSLLANEHILWAGKPKQGVALSARDGFLIPFSLLWGGFALFWNIAVWTFPTDGNGTGWFMRLWGLPFLVVGLYLIFGRFLHDSAIRKRLNYAVTDRRVLISRQSLFSSRITSLDLHRLPRLELTEFRDQTGTLTFEAEGFNLFSASAGMNWWLPSVGTGIQFFRIEHPRMAYDLIRKQSTS